MMAFPARSIRHEKAVLGSVFLGLSLLEGAAALLWILSVPSDPDVWRFLGYSAQRWVIILAAALLTGMFSAFFHILQRLSSKPEASLLTRRAEWFRAARTGVVILLLLNLRLIFFLQTFDHPAAQPMYLRLLPLSILLALLPAQMSVYLFLLLPPATTLDLRRAAALWFGFAIFGLIFVITRFGLVKISNGWYEYGVPLLHIQILDILLLAVIASCAISALEHQPAWNRLRAALPAITMDAVLMLLIWLAAVGLWLPMPIPNTWMSPSPLPPNNAVYPNSDAMFYDSAAQGILFGAEWARTTAHYKPLYVAFLALAHAAGGYGYEPVIRIQTFILAILPVLLYVVGRLLHSRLAGLLIASAVILREYNQLLVGSQVTSSNSKLLLSEMPTAIGISALLIVLICWLRFPRQRSALALVAGGVIGLTAQVRMQVIAFLPSLLVLAGLFYARKWKASLRTAILLCLGLFLSLALLLARNIRATGMLTIEKPGYMQRTLDYAFTPTVDYNYGKLWMISSGFVHNTVQALLTLPSGYNGERIWTNTNDLPERFWITDSAALSPGQAFWVLFNLGCICIGIIAAWQRSRWAALLPAVAFAIYNLASVAGGFSGQRFLLPVDWVGYFYFAIGLTVLAKTLVNADHDIPAGSLPRMEINDTLRKSGWKAYRSMAAIALALFIVGGLLPLIEALIPIRYGSASQAGARQALNAAAVKALEPQALADFQSLLNQPETVVLQGVALYPREVGEKTAPGSYISTDPEVGAPFLTYLYLGQVNATVLQPSNGASSALPHASEVIVAGRWVRERFHAFATVQPAVGKIYFSPAREK